MPRSLFSCSLVAGLIILFMLTAEKLPAQVLNIDRELPADSIGKKNELAFSLFLSTDKQKQRLLNISGNFEYDRYLKNRYVLVALFRGASVFNGRDMIQNEGITHFRYRDNDHRKWSPEFFLQYQWNGAWGMEYRNVAGANLRIKLLEKEKNDLYAGIGGFYETERWNWVGVKEDLVPSVAPDVFRNLWRMNTYLKLSYKLTKNMDISSATFLQFPLTAEFGEPRWYLEANLFVSASKKLEFVVHWDHIYDSFRAVPIDDFYYTFSMGIQLKL